MQLSDSSQQQLAILLLLFVICCSCSVFATRSIDVLLNELVISLDLYRIITYFIVKKLLHAVLNSHEEKYDRKFSILFIYIYTVPIFLFMYCGPEKLSQCLSTHNNS